MKIPKIYIETSVFNYYFASDSPRKHSDTLRLFKKISLGKYEPYTSEFAIGELYRASEPKRSQMLRLIPEYGITALPGTDEVQRLADIYVTEGIVPAKCVTDAIHIAITSVYGLDFIVSLNFRHIVRAKTISMVKSVNQRECYEKIGIYSPAEVVENDK